MGLFLQWLSGFVKPQRVPKIFVALAIQSVSLLICFITLTITRQYFTVYPNLFGFLLAHALLAAVFSYFCRLDWWWWFIQLAFPLLSYGCVFLDFPPYYYLLTFCVMCLLYWSTFRTQVPYFPSRTSIIPHLLKYIPQQESIKFIDIGSGMGGLLIKLAQERENSHFFGFEIAPLPWLISTLRAIFLKSKVKFHLGDYQRLDLSEFDVVFCYLSPAVMSRLWEKVEHEMKAGSIFFSYEFVVPSKSPDLLIKIDASDKFLYGWRI